MNRQNLYEKLIEYSRSDAYPFHMPGHKRRMLSMEDPYRFDLTEIDGFDNLHEAEELLKWEQERVAALYGSEESHFMVNGSTGGLLAAIAGVTHRGDRVLVARNCHTSVYHALMLNGLRPVYMWPELDAELGINKGFHRADVEKYLEKYDDIRAVILTSPTYEGLLSDVKGICEAAHERGIPCVVDEAHGAHLRWIGMTDAVASGADVVIQSLHKTMPALTQTALMHINGTLVNKERLRKMLATYQTSSPSYVLMASMSLCMTWLEEEGKEAFEQYEQQTMKFRKRMSKLKHLSLYDTQDAFDWGKCVIGTQNTSKNGRWLYDCLRKEFGLQMEMVSDQYVLAMSTVGDSEDGLKRLAEALEALDARLEASERIQMQRTLSVPKRALEMDEAVELPSELIGLWQAQGRILSDFIYLYPPGIPLMVPGEIFYKEQMEQIDYFLSQGLEVHGGYMKENGHVKVILHHGEKCIG